MTIQTNLLEMRLGQLQARAQQLLADKLVPAGGLLDDGRVWFDKPEVVAFWQSLDGLDVELQRTLRQFNMLERQCAAMQAQLGAVPQDQRWREIGRIKSFENDLGRVVAKAAKLAALLVDLRKRGGLVSDADLAQAILNLGTEVGKSFDQAMVRRTVQEVGARPTYSLPQTATPNLAGVIEVFFVVISMVSILVRRRRQ